MADIVAKIREGTRSDETDLCKSCAYCTIIKGSRESEEYRHCSEINKMLTIRIADCNAYYNKNLPSVKTLYETATLITIDKTGRIGFSPYGKFEDDKKSHNSFDKDYL